MLLVHESDMTPTLESFHGERIHLRVLDCRVAEEQLAREVVLVGSESGRGLEFGAILIHFDLFPQAARAVIRECRVPLGTILAQHRIEHRSRPQGFFHLEADAAMREALGLDAPVRLYGRHNHLAASDGRILADVVEILPPAEDRT
jgi:chorismate-pyruvate lyase